MENGTYLYNLEMTTPLGIRHGSLELIVWKNFLNGYLTMFTRTIPIGEGMCDGNNVSFRGDMKTLMKMIPYQAEGQVSGNKISLDFMSESGHYHATGALVKSSKEKEV